MNRNIVLIVFLNMFVAQWFFAETNEEAHVVGLKKLSEFELSEATIDDAVLRLRKCGVRVCIDKSSKQVTKKSFNMRDQSVGKIMDEITREFEGYTWHANKQKNLIRIKPKDSSVLNWNLKNLNINDKPFIDVILKDDLLKLLENDVCPLYRGSSKPAEVKVSLEVTERPVSDCLEELVAQVPRLCWTMYRNSNGLNVLVFSFARDLELTSGRAESKSRKGVPVPDKNMD